MRLAQIAGGKVVNVSISTPGQEIPAGWIASETAGIGWDVVNGEPVAPVPPAPVVTVPDRVSRFQARAALMQAGLLDQAGAAVAQAGPLAQLAWNDAVEFRRNSPTINALAPALGLTAEQIDALFIAAAQIEA